jgi:hypothetical protein
MSVPADAQDKLKHVPQRATLEIPSASSAPSALSGFDFDFAFLGVSASLR